MKLKQKLLLTFLVFTVSYPLSAQVINLEGRFIADSNFFNLNSAFIFSTKNQLQNTIYFKPILNFNLGSELGKSAIGNTGVGVYFEARYNKFSILALPEFGVAYQPQFIRNKAVNEKHLTGAGFLLQGGTNNAQYYATTPFVLQYNPGKFFTISIGNGKNFLGNGYRSLLLSDYARNYGFAAVQTKIWKLHYVNLYGALYQDAGFNSSFTHSFNKFFATHYLTWQVNKSLSISAFETVVWRSRDTLVTRSFDPNYLNPIIFYRPIEYSTGSSDNVLLGLNINFIISKSFKVYGQALIDEFLLSAVRADLQAFLYPSKPTTTPTGWWANKHAGQVGVSYFKKLNNLKVFSFAELNYVRPYTYSHLNLFENYGHHFAPLAHPLGANFLEVVHNTALQSKKLFCSFYISYFFKGIDQPNVSWGGDVNKSYLLRPAEYGHTIGQGIPISNFSGRLKMGYLINSRINQMAFLEFGWRRSKIHQIGFFTEQNQNTVWFNIGVSTRIFNNQNLH